MTWWTWVLVIWTALNVLAKIALTGERKTPDVHSPGEAVATLLYGVAIIWTITVLAGA